VPPALAAPVPKYAFSQPMEELLDFAAIEELLLSEPPIAGGPFLGTHQTLLQQATASEIGGPWPSRQAQGEGAQYRVGGERGPVWLPGSGTPGGRPGTSPRVGPGRGGSSVQSRDNRGPVWLPSSGCGVETQPESEQSVVPSTTQHTRLITGAGKGRPGAASWR